MKRNLLLTTLFFIILLNTGKAQSYSFSHTTATYSNLSSATVISTPYWDDFTVFGVPLPFQFTYFGMAFDSVYTNGSFEGFIYDGNGGFGDYELGSYEYTELSDNANNTATISVGTSGTAPNRIFIIETKDAGFYNDQTDLDYANLQVWFYETSNVIEIHFGPNSVVNPDSWEIPGSTGPGIILAQTAINYLALSGPASNPNATTSFVNYTVNGAPADGMVYRFAPTGTGIDENASDNSFSLFPNPCNGNFSVAVKDFSTNADLSVYDLNGKMVYHSNVYDQLNVKLSLAAGIYTAVVSDGEKRVRRNVVIQ